MPSTAPHSRPDGCVEIGGGEPEAGQPRIHGPARPERLEECWQVRPEAADYDAGRYGAFRIGEASLRAVEIRKPSLENGQRYGPWRRGEDGVGPARLSL